MKRSHHGKKLKKKKSPQGFTLLEATVSMFLLSFAILLNLPLLVVLQNENTTSKAKLGASSLARDVLDEIRSQRVIKPVNGELETGLDKLGYEYDATTYICTDKPDVDEETFVVTGCSTNDANNTDLRYVVIQIKRNGQTEPIHTVETAFTRVTPPPAAN